MRRRGIEITREELVLISLGILQDRSPCEDNVSDISDLPDLLGIDRTTLLRYFGNLSNMELIKKLGRRPFRIRLSGMGKKKYAEIMEGLKGIYLDHNRYSIERKVKLDYFIKALRAPKVLIPLLNELQKRNGFDIMKFIHIESGMQEGSKFMSLKRELITENYNDGGQPRDLSSLNSINRDRVQEKEEQPIVIDEALLEADILRRQGRIQDSIHLFQRILESGIATEGDSWIMAKMGYIQTIRYSMNVEEALKEIDTTLSKTSENNHKGLLKRLKADIYSDLHRFEDAGKLYRSALGHFHATRSFNLLAICLNNIGVMYFRMGKEGEAGIQWKKVRTLSRKEDIPWARALSLTNLSDLSARNGKFPTARNMLIEAREIFLSIGDLEGTSEVDFNSSLVNIEDGKRNAAIKYFKEMMKFPMRYDIKRKERWEVFKTRFEEKGWELPFHLKTPP